MDKCLCFTLGNLAACPLFTPRVPSLPTHGSQMRPFLVPARKRRVGGLCTTRARDTDAACAAGCCGVCTKTTFSSPVIHFVSSTAAAATLGWFTTHPLLEEAETLGSEQLSPDRFPRPTSPAVPYGLLPESE
jgi:hypothetical protein